VLQVASGLQRLHTAQPDPIVHGDVKCANVLIEDDGKGAVIADFGLARAVRDAGGMSSSGDVRGVAGGALTVSISPPEVLRDTRAPRGPPVDVYALGIVLHEMMTGRAAYTGMRKHEVVRCVLEGGRPPVPPGMREDVSCLIRDCWAQEAADRPTAGEVVARLTTVIKQLAGADALLTTTVATDTLSGTGFKDV
jgi:serine/threonine protein kinase